MKASQLRERLLGSWRLVSWEWRNAKGTVESPMGEHPVGQLTYDASGTVSAHLMRRDQPRFRSDDFLEATADEKAAAWSGYFGYFGTYTIGDAADTIVHHVEGGSFPNLVGTDQLRFCRLTGNRLSLDADAPWGRVSLVWQKVER